MADLKSATTGYPSAIDTYTLWADNTDDVIADSINNALSAIVAIEGELGASVKGSASTLAARISVNTASNGSVPQGTSFPVSPTPVGGQLFVRTDYSPWRLYMYDGTMAQWNRIESITDHGALTGLGDDDHTQYVHNSTARTISARHSFTNDPPFNISGTTEVTNLNSQMVGGKTPETANGLATLTAASLLAQNAPSGFTINGNTAWHSGNDGAGSGLDADTVDGLNPGSASGLATLTAASLLAQNAPSGFTINGSTAWHAGNDGSGSGLDADFVKGYTPNAYEYGGSGSSSPIIAGISGGVKTNDRILVIGYSTGSSTATGNNTATLYLDKNSGTSTGQFFGGSSSVYDRRYTNAGLSYSVSISGVWEVTGDGTLNLAANSNFDTISDLRIYTMLLRKYP